MTDKLIIKIPHFCQSEIKYIISVMLKDFLGLEYDLEVANGKNIEIRNQDIEGKLTLNTDFFDIVQNFWLKEESLPVMPLKYWIPSEDGLDVDLVESEIPIIYGKPSLIKNKNHLHLNLDVFGSSFFMLSRYEEVIKTDRDQHDRFPAKASLAYQENFLERPIVNEYLEILWACLKLLWPGLERKKRNFQMNVTCDVDHPYQIGIKNPLRQLRHIGGDLLRRKSPLQAIKTTINYFTTKLGNFSFDPNYTRITWMMDVNEKAGNKVAFYFMAGCTDKKMDSGYSLNEPAIRKLMRQIHKRGHEIGIHPSYNTCQDRTQLYKEVENLQLVMKEEGIVQKKIGGRQHYLRWETPKTAQNWDNSGLDYDSTLYFSEQVGFRCGVCYEYQLYDALQRKTLKLRERPLIVMEVTLFDIKDLHNDVDKENFLTMVHNLAKTVKLFNGDFTILWHNSSFIDKPWYSECYEDIICL